MKSNSKNLTLLGSALLASTVSSQGAISFVNSIIDTRNTTRSGNVNSTPALESEVIQWSDSTFTKTLDIDGDNRYGTDGFVLLNTTNTGGGRNSPGAALSGSAQRAPDFATAGISALADANFSGAFQNPSGTTGLIRNDANDATVRLGYGGINLATPNAAIPLTDLYSFTLTSALAANETLRFGVFSGSNNSDTRLGFTELTVTAGAFSASTTDDRVANVGNAPDIYFFDITDLAVGDTIVVSAANSITGGNNFNGATIGGVTFDTFVVPEPSSAALLGLGGLALLLRRRK